MTLEWWPQFIKRHPDPLVIFRTPQNTLTREGALAMARELWGDLGTISSDESMPRLVWCIGQFDRTVGRGRTWEIALERSRTRKARLDRQALDRMASDSKEAIADAAHR